MVQQLTTYWQGLVGGKKSDHDIETVILIKRTKFCIQVEINGKGKTVCLEETVKEGILLSSK